MHSGQNPSKKMNPSSWQFSHSNLRSAPYTVTPGDGMALAPVALNQFDNHSAPYWYELSIAAINDYSDLLNYWRIIRELNPSSVRHLKLAKQPDLRRNPQ